MIVDLESHTLKENKKKIFLPNKNENNKIQNTINFLSFQSQKSIEIINTSIIILELILIMLIKIIKILIKKIKNKR